MAEITRIITLEITEVIEPRDTEYDDIPTKEEAKKTLRDDLMRTFGFDDVVITNIQDFIRDEDTKVE
jgi:hypothetical protein